MGEPTLGRTEYHPGRMEAGNPKGLYRTGCLIDCTMFSILQVHALVKQSFSYIDAE